MRQLFVSGLNVAGCVQIVDGNATCAAPLQA
jgi:hypothetical protein